MSLPLAELPEHPPSDDHPLTSPFAALLDDLDQRGWSVQRGFLDAEQIDALRAESFTQWWEGAYRPAAVGRGGQRQVRPEIRGDHVHWLDRANAGIAQRAYIDTMEQLRVAANHRLLLGLDRFELHAARYPEGTGYRRHLDRFQGCESRRVTCVLYLNEGWRKEEGGALRLYADQGAVDVYPEAGTLAAFITDGMWHEVLPATRPRFALTGWFRRDGDLPL